MIGAGKTLTDRAILRNSLNVRASKNKVSVGTKIVYAAVHQFGFNGTVNISGHPRDVMRTGYRLDLRSRKMVKRKKKVKHNVYVEAYSRKMNIGARPFLGVRDEDWPEIKQTLTDYLLRGR